MKAVIVGNGIAGVMTASRLRALEPDPERLSIDVYAREPHDYYARIRLPEVFASRLSAEDLAVYKPGWYDGKSIRVHRGLAVEAIDRERRRVRLSDGTEAAYDKLALCAGAECARPPIAHGDLEGIFTVREYADADAVRRRMAEGTRHALVVGGGLLGLEAARHLSLPGVEVTVAEIAPRLLPRQLDEEGARILRRLLEGPAFRVLLGVKAQSFLGDGKVSGLRLEDGREVPAQTVILSAGIAPRTALAREAGLEVRRGIVVDEHMRTADPDVYAVGDDAEFGGIVWGILPAAMEQAPVAAANMLGGAAVYAQTIPQNTLKVAGIHLTSAGRTTFDQGGEEAFTVVRRADEAAGRYEKYVLGDGKLQGAILLGTKANLKFVTRTMGRPATEAEVRALPW